MPEVHRVTPPAALMQPTPAPVMSGSTNGALLDYALDARASLDQCNADKASMRQWTEGGRDE